MYLLPVAKTRQVPSTVEPSTNTNVFSPEQLTIPLEKYYALIRLNRKNIYCNNEFERKTNFKKNLKSLKSLYTEIGGCCVYKFTLPIQCTRFNRQKIC